MRRKVRVPDPRDDRGGAVIPLGQTGPRTHRANVRLSEADVAYLDELKRALGGGAWGTTEVLRTGLGLLGDRLGVPRPGRP